MLIPVNVKMISKELNATIRYDISLPVKRFDDMLIIRRRILLESEEEGIGLFKLLQLFGIGRQILSKHADMIL